MLKNCFPQVGCNNKIQQLVITTQPLRPPPTVVFLGVVIDENIKWGQHTRTAYFANFQSHTYVLRSTTLGHVERSA